MSYTRHEAIEALRGLRGLSRLDDIERVLDFYGVSYEGCDYANGNKVCTFYNMPMTLKKIKSAHDFYIPGKNAIPPEQYIANILRIEAGRILRKKHQSIYGKKSFKAYSRWRDKQEALYSKKINPSCI